MKTVRNFAGLYIVPRFNSDMYLVCALALSFPLFHKSVVEIQIFTLFGYTYIEAHKIYRESNKANYYRYTVFATPLFHPICKQIETLNSPL